MQHRRLGQTDLEVTILGLGGVTICERRQADVDAEVRWAYDRGSGILMWRRSMRMHNN